MSELRLFQTAHGDVRELAPRLAEAEADVQRLVEANVEALLGVRFLASEYGTGPVHAGRIDSLGIDVNGAPVVVEYKRGTDPGVINQGLFYLSWLVDHRSEFEQLVRDKLGFRSVSRDPIPSFSVTACKAAVSFGWSSRTSATMRTARRRSSSG